MKKPRKFQAGIDSLESRMVLSTVQPAAHVIPLHGSGSLSLGASMSTTNEVRVVVSMAGTFSGLGNAKGTLNTIIETSNLSFHASGPITGADGDQLNISFSGMNQKAHAHQNKAVGRFHFNVEGGTGPYANATGGGTITITQNLETGQETFSLKGKIRE